MGTVQRKGTRQDEKSSLNGSILVSPIYWLEVVIRKGASLNLIHQVLDRMRSV